MKISIIVPVYNIENYLPKCIESILNQTYSDFEAIFVDDGSTDGSYEILEKQTDPRIIVLHKQNGGLMSAVIAGINEAKGTYICFVDGDDFISDDYLKVLVESLDSETDMACMQCVRFYNENIKTKCKINSLNSGDIYLGEEFYSVFINDKGSNLKPIANARWSKLIRADIVKNCVSYYKKDISFGEDQLLTVAVLLYCKKIKVLDEYKYFYRYNPNSIVNTYKNNFWENCLNLIKLLRKLPKIDEKKDAENQINTQLLLYAAECFRNEVNGKKLKKDFFLNVIENDEIQAALKNYSNEKMSSQNRRLIKYMTNRAYIKLKLNLKIHLLVYKLKTKMLIKRI